MEATGDVEVLAVALAFEKHRFGAIRAERCDGLAHQGASDPGSVQHRIDHDAADPGMSAVVGMRCLHVHLELPVEDFRFVIGRSFGVDVRADVTATRWGADAEPDQHITDEGS